jgi:dihydrodipicolinate synthase/N-acetylneuraminate lyase
MSVAERKQLLEAVIDLMGSFVVIAGTGAANLPDAIELSQHAAEAGADAALVLPPFFFKNPSAQGVAAFFRPLLDAAEIPVLLYSIPQQTAVQITDEIIGQLADHPRLAGLKDSKGDWETTSGLISKWPKLSIFSGGDQIMSRSLGAGSAGAISGSANAFPDLVAAVKHSVGSEGAEDAQARLTAAKDITIQYPLIAAVKSVLAHRGVPRMYVRPPLVDLTPVQETEMIGKLQSAGLLG